ncbi:MAG: lysylphosphatidylglycerol synthase domain-containing protein [Pseudomonadota bacterium]|nr:lysylphosphatidylglycerol synthase domain-containing protein [Pseudomonadota bacterium]
MKRIARVLAIVGLALAATLFVRANIGRIAELVFAAVPGLVVAGGFHVFPMIVNAVAWRRLLPVSQRPRVRVLAHAVWIRESVNGVLPVARIGGEIAAYRVLCRTVASRADAAASVAADMALSVLSQSVFALAGLCMLFAVGHTSVVAARLLTVAGVMLALGAGFVLVQRAGGLAAMTGLVDRLFVGKLGATRARSLRLDRALRRVYERRGDVGACVAWQLVAWILGAGEIWLALYFLGQPRDLYDAIVIEALIQAISSAAFVVPAALGIQEGGFLLIGAALGIDASTSLALAAARRLRDLIIYLPGLLAWHRAEIRNRGQRCISRIDVAP